MKYFLFQQQFASYNFFSTDMVYQVFPDFDKRRLSEWKQQGKILSIKRGWWCFADRPRSREFLFSIANAIYTPSYISMETALAYYGLIPETVITTKSCSTKKTFFCKEDIGTFRYQKIHTRLYTGYTLLQYGNIHISIASPAKAICDMLYFSPSLSDSDAFDERRINIDVVREIINKKDFEIFLPIYTKTTQKRIYTFISYIRPDA